MEEEKKEGAKTCGVWRCCGCQFFTGLLVGLLLAGAGFGLYMAGHCSGHKCPMSVTQPQPAK